VMASRRSCLLAAAWLVWMSLGIAVVFMLLMATFSLRR
jgi:hypothetical protein